MKPVYQFHQGQAPLLISMPHVGTEIAPDIQQQLLPIAEQKADTDWHLPLLYNMAKDLGASVIQAEYSRYVIDLNRSSDDSNLYPGQDTTGLIPLDTFDKQALYSNGNTPSEAEVQKRVQNYWLPYHTKLQNELERIRAQHGVAVLWDAHSIASVVPRFFAGKLPDLNFGTADGKSSAASLQAALAQSLMGVPYTHVFNGRFKGGFITRQYGQPSRNIHAVQLEMSQCTYMDESAPYAYRPDLAEQIQPHLKQLLESSIAWAHQNAASAE